MRNKEFVFGEGRISGYLSALLGILSLFAVFAFLYPEYLTTPDLRKEYPVEILRDVLMVCLILSYAFAILTFFLNKKKTLGIIGLGCSTVAILLGGWQIEVKEFDQHFAFIGLDWIVLDFLILAIIFIPIEKFFPNRKNQIILRPEWQTDLSYFCVGHLFIQIIAMVTIMPATLLSETFNLNFLQVNISTWPWIVQFFAAILITDLFLYFIHRLFHISKILWPFHAIHHSIKSIDWLAGSRLHFVDIFISRAIGFAPTFLLGFPFEIVTSYIIFVAFHTVFIHSNTNVDFKFLKYVFVTPQYHNWHHSADPSTFNKNYAVHLPLIDYIFGTYYFPINKQPSYFGIDLELPNSYIGQFIYPFRKK